jgi:hypothetical protein
MRGCLTLIVGIVAGLALTAYWWPRVPAGVNPAPRSDITLTVSDGSLARLIQRRVAGMTAPSIQGVTVTSAPPNALVTRAQVVLGPVSSSAAVEVQPVAVNGGIQARVLSSTIAGLPMPPPLLQAIETEINRSMHGLLPADARVTGVAVRPAGLEITAQYRGR